MYSAGVLGYGYRLQVGVLGYGLQGHSTRSLSWNAMESGCYMVGPRARGETHDQERQSVCVQETEGASMLTEGSTQEAFFTT